jgi:hypothetical protein
MEERLCICGKPMTARAGATANVTIWTCASGHEQRQVDTSALDALAWQWMQTVNLDDLDQLLKGDGPLMNLPHMGYFEDAPTDKQGEENDA